MRRLKYYFGSIVTILREIKNWYVVFQFLLGKPYVIIELKQGYMFKVRSLMDVFIVKETCLDREYEVQSTQIRDGWTVLDIGAGLGDFGILVGKENPNSRIFAYEPFPESFKLFEENVDLNNVTNVSAFQVAIGAEKGKMKLFTTGEAVQHTTTGSTFTNNSKFTRDVQGLSLVDAMEVNGITHCDFLKIDCEGCEFDILFNTCQSVLDKISRICLEYHDGFTNYSHLDLVKYLRDSGYQVKVTPNPIHSYLGYIFASRAT